jgi:subtilisin family serine protease
MSANVKRLSVRVLVLAAAAMLASAAASPATASGRHGHGVEGGWHHGNGQDPDRFLTMLTPTSLPILDDVLNGQMVSTQAAVTRCVSPAARLLSRGAGITVAVCDGGFDLRHQALAGHLVQGYDAVDEDDDPTDLGNGIDDDQDGQVDGCVGHGTFVSSLILAVAPDAKIMPIRVSSDEGGGNDFDLVNAIEYARTHGADIINCSLVMPLAAPVLKAEVQLAVSQGIVIVGSAGYVEDGWQTDPSLQDRVLGVGAVTLNDSLVPFSPTGILVDTYAPGVDLIGALGGAHENSYAHWSGTSFATPLVSGVAALVMSREPLLLNNMVCSRIRNHADLCTGITPYTRGRVDALRAMLNN